MAFGSTATEARTVAEGGDTKAFECPFLSDKSGIRRMRFLPEVDENGEIRKVQLTDPTGKALKGKFTTVTEGEVRWLEAWITVNAGGTQRKQRVILDWKNPWKNPVWEYLSANFEKGSPERKQMKQRFGINVLDLTPVLISEKGQVVYPDINGTYNIVGCTSKPIEVVVGDPQPHNKVRIFEGSTGDKDGKHLFQQLMDAADELESPGGIKKQLHEVVSTLKTKGEGIKTTRVFKTTGEFEGSSPSQIALPRYDIASWAKPWPNEMVKRLMELEDLNDLVPEYGIILMPQLRVTKETDASEDEEALFAD